MGHIERSYEGFLFFYNSAQNAYEIPLESGRDTSITHKVHSAQYHLLKDTSSSGKDGEDKKPETETSYLVDKLRDLLSLQVGREDKNGYHCELWDKTGL